MSFDLFICPLPDAAWTEADRIKIVQILYRDAVTTHGYPDYGYVCYADGGAREISGLEDWDEGLKQTGLCFRRFGGPTFSDRLYELADRLDAMVFWPGEPPFVAVTRHDLMSRLPAELEPDQTVVVGDAACLMMHITK